MREKLTVTDSLGAVTRPTTSLDTVGTTVSFYDHLYVRGYVRQVPGAAMCGCMKQMPVATRSDGTQVDVLETFNLVYDAGSGMSATITNSEVEFNACEAEEDDNDLRAYW